jgi:hypothetical protein
MFITFYLRNAFLLPNDLRYKGVIRRAGMPQGSEAVTKKFF